MAKRRRSKKSISQMKHTDLSEIGSVMLGLAILSVIIAFVAIALGVAVVLFPLILIPMWRICKEWSRGIKILISVLVMIIWLLLLPFTLGFLGDMLFVSEDEHVLIPTTTPVATDSPLPTSTPITLPTLTKGMAGEHVVTLQNRLINLRYLEGDADGQFGPKTEESVKGFQEKNNLIADGVVDTDTCSVLFSDDALGYYSGDLEWITRNGHPTFFESNESAHYVWRNVEKGKIIYADENTRYERGKTVLIIDGYEHEEYGIIRDIELYLKNCNPPVKVTMDEAVQIAAEYFPYRIAEQYYELGRSYYQHAENSGSDSYYVCYYHLTEEAKNGYYSKEHPYPGNMCIIFYVNPDGYVDLFRYTFGTPNGIGDRANDDWDFDFMKMK